MADPSHDATSKEKTAQGPVWSFRGYRISPGEFTTAMVHFYRGEMSRSNTWRTRLDSTTNWAVVTTAAALTFAFGAPSNPHFMILFVMLLVILFLYIEARRYRYYELWAYRVRLMETDFFAGMLVPPFAPGGEWAERLAESLLDPTFPISGWEAIGRRLRRNYLWILALLSLSWAVKVALHPLPLSTGDEFLARAGIGPVSGWWIVAGVVLLNCSTLLMGLAFVQFARLWGAARIIAFDFSGWRLAKARRLGADHTINPQAEDGKVRLFELNEGRGADSVIVTPHHLGPVEFGLSLAGKGATVHVFAPPPPDAELKLNLNDFFFRQLTLTTSYSTTHIEISQVLDLMANGRIATQELITHRFGLHQVAEAIQLLQQTGESLKSVIVPALTVGRGSDIRD